MLPYKHTLPHKRKIRKGLQRGRPNYESRPPALAILPCNHRSPPRVCAGRDGRAEARILRAGAEDYTANEWQAISPRFCCSPLPWSLPPRAISTTNLPGNQRTGPRNLEGWRRGLPAPLPSKPTCRRPTLGRTAHTHQLEARKSETRESGIQRKSPSRKERERGSRLHSALNVDQSWTSDRRIHAAVSDSGRLIPKSSKKLRACGS